MRAELWMEKCERQVFRGFVPWHLADGACFAPRTGNFGGTRERITMAGAGGEELVGFQVRLEAFGEVDGPDEILASRNIVAADPAVHGLP